MGKRIVSFDVEDDKLVTSTGSKKIMAKESLPQKEVEKFGIVEINNAQAKSKVKSQSDLGYEKHNVGAKRGVKANLNKVDDYFDFNFRQPSKKEENQVKSEAKDCKNSVAEVNSDIEVIKEKIKADTIVLKAEPQESRSSSVTAEASDRVLDQDAERIITVARMGALFDCEIRHNICK